MKFSEEERALLQQRAKRNLENPPKGSPSLLEYDEENEPKSLWETDKPAARALAQDLYFRFYSYGGISKLTGIPVNTLKSWVYRNSWASLRSQLHEKLEVQALGAHMEELDPARGLLIKAMHNWVRMVNEEELWQKWKPNDFDKVGNTLYKMDRVCRLEEGKPTERLQVDVWNEKEIRAEIRRLATEAFDEDPMMIEDAEFEEVDDPTLQGEGGSEEPEGDSGVPE